MSDRRRCTATNERGLPCGAAPLHDRSMCGMHDPEHAEEAAAARRLGGLRRRRESTLQAAYDLGELGTHEGLLRYLEIGAFDLLQLDNGIARVRAIIALVGTGARLLDRDLEDRIAALERAMATRRPWEPSGPLVPEDGDAHD